MNAPSNWAGSLASLADGSIGLMLVAKCTLLLALAWLGHAALARRNPRWRVVLWRGATLGIGLVAALTAVPPLVRLPIEPDTPRALAERHNGIAVPSRLASAAVGPVTGLPGATHRATEAPAAVTLPGPAAAALPDPIAAPRWSVRSLAASWALWAWLAGALVLTARLVLTGVALDRIIRRGSEVSDDLIKESRLIARELGWTGIVRVVCSAEVATPCLAGLARPVLLLPSRLGPEQDDLPAILAHEMAHARHHDLAWNLAAHVASIALWFHPLAWRIRAVHATACDAVSDAVAADYVGDVASYGRALARQALRAARPSPIHVLAMARSSDIRRRLEALNRQVFRAPLSWRLFMPAMLVSGAILVLIGGFGFTRAEQAANPPAQQTPGKLTLHALAAKTDRPIEGVSIEYRGRFDGKDRNGTAATGKDGLATIDYPAGALIESFEITARKAGFAALCYVWDNERHPVSMPSSKDLRFAPGTTIGGIVQDEAGQPIAGARVDVFGPPTECESAHRVFTIGTSETDARGRWRLDIAPKDLSNVFVRPQHPRYMPTGASAAPNLDGVIVLTRGSTVTGRVVDAGGRPVKGARAQLGGTFEAFVPVGTTDDRGTFTLDNCQAGSTTLTVQADGFAPQVQDVKVEGKTEPVAVTLSERAATLRGRVVDARGKPVAGAIVGADTWRGMRTLSLRATTDADGRFEWRGAPPDVVVYDAFKRGYMSSRQVPLIASDREHAITLYPELVITGRVTDAETGRPLPGFRLILGRKYPRRDETHWAENEAVEVAGGRYTTRFSEPADAILIRVEAPGYQSAESRAFRPSEGSQTFDIALRRGGGLSGVVLLPDGKPAAGAEVVLATETLGFLMQAGRYDRRSNFPMVRTGPDGRFTLHSTVDNYLLVAACDAGYADASQDEFARSGKLVLKPWGKIEGMVWIGDRSGADQEIVYNNDISPRGGRYYGLDYGYRTRTDARGRFAFDRVLPGRGKAVRVLNDNTAWGWQEPVAVEPGRTTRVRVGGRGRVVIGRLVFDHEPATPIDWTRNPPVMIHGPPGKSQFISNLDKDGRFRIEDVLPGKYRIRIGSPNLPAKGVETRIGWLERDLDVPEAPAGQPVGPLDLGAIEAHLTVGAGDAAPDFDVERIDDKGKGDRIRLSDERGKIVLIDFWATWCGPCVAELPTLKGIQEAFGGDSRFRLISLSCDETVEPVLRVVKEKGLAWRHGLAGSFGASVMARYDVRAIPSTFLIGPDGRILARDQRGAALKEAIAKALKDDGIFAGRRSPR
jgi:beta-lactamase regulating signal transducer with metallopeptidase domain/thiol-disulfide isomerase/thioredoxin/protocatechuate 3,4-dioxygenase beta subunit